MERNGYQSRDNVRERLSCIRVLKDDSETGMAVLVGCRNRQATTEIKLSDRFGFKGRSNRRTATHNHPAEDVTSQMDASFVSRCEQVRDGGLASRHRTRHDVGIVL